MLRLRAASNSRTDEKSLAHLLCKSLHTGGNCMHVQLQMYVQIQNRLCSFTEHEAAGLQMDFGCWPSCNKYHAGYCVFPHNTARHKALYANCLQHIDMTDAAGSVSCMSKTYIYRGCNKLHSVPKQSPPSGLISHSILLDAIASLQRVSTVHTKPQRPCSCA
jgi:hypothetical protein